MNAALHLHRTQRTLRMAAALYAAGLAATTIGATHLLIALLLPTLATVATWTVALGIGGATWWVEFVRRGARALTLERSALWVEEHVPAMQYALVSTLTATTPLRDLDRTIDHDLWRRAEQSSVTRATWRCAAMVLLGAFAWFGSRSLPAAALGGRDIRDDARERLIPGGAAFRVRATVVPPAYSQLPRQALSDPTTVRALVGSTLMLDVSDSAATVRLGDRMVPSTLSSDGRHLDVPVPARSQALTIASPLGSRVVVLDVLPDSAPTVTMMRPVRDSVLRTPTGTIALGATLHDDLGLAFASFEYIVSSGDGESFAFRSGTVGARAFMGTRDGEIATTLSLAAIQLKAGDIVHLRAVARDRNDVTGPGIGRSETRTLRIARSGEYDSVAVEGAAPPEDDKSVMSQRMLINMAEALRKRRKASSRESFLAESAKLARDQARLRRQVGDIVFDRLGDNPSGEHSHDDDDRRPLTKEELLKAAEEATKVDSEVLDFANDETPVTGINRPLLEAYNAMWDAGRELGIAQPERALPHMHRALAAIQRARSAERLYLRGKAPLVVVDVPRVRLQGKDKGSSSARTSRVDNDSVRVADRRRFANAVSAMMATPAAAIDSLMMLRVSLIDRNAGAARALDAATEALRAGRDATAPLIQARRALEGGRVVSDSVSRWNRGSSP